MSYLYARFHHRLAGACAVGGLLITAAGHACASSEQEVLPAVDVSLTEPISEVPTTKVVPADAETRVAQAQAPENQTTAESPSAPESQPDYKRFHKALRERDISVGYGEKVPTSRLDGRSNVTLFQFLPRWGRFRDERQELLWEVPITYADSPHSALAAGVTLMYRYHFTSRHGFVPFVEAGSGFVVTNLNEKIKELGGHFQFSPQAGAGFRAAVGGKSDVVVAARWYHLSNGGMRSPNTGLNNYLITVGYSQFF